MACEAALRMGAGLVTLGIPKSLNAIMEVKLTEVMTEPLPETPKQTLSLRAFNSILRLCENKKALVIGPGMGTFKETQSLILKLIKAVDLPMVIDADGLTALSAQTQDSSRHKSVSRPYAPPRRNGQAYGIDGQRDPGRSNRHQQRLLSIPSRSSCAQRASNLDRNPSGRNLHQPNGQSRHGLRRNRGCAHRVWSEG